MGKSIKHTRLEIVKRLGLDCDGDGIEMGIEMGIEIDR